MPGQEPALRQVSFPREQAKATACTVVPGEANALLNLRAELPRLKVSGGMKWKLPYFHFKHVPAINPLFE